MAAPILSLLHFITFANARCNLACVVWMHLRVQYIHYGCNRFVYVCAVFAIYQSHRRPWGSCLHNNVSHCDSLDRIKWQLAVKTTCKVSSELWILIEGMYDSLQHLLNDNKSIVEYRLMCCIDVQCSSRNDSGSGNKWLGGISWHESSVIMLSQRVTWLWRVRSWTECPRRNIQRRSLTHIIPPCFSVPSSPARWSSYARGGSKYYG